MRTSSGSSALARRRRLRDDHADDDEDAADELDRRQHLAQQDRREGDRPDRLDRADERRLRGADPPGSSVERLRRDGGAHDADPDEPEPGLRGDLPGHHRPGRQERRGPVDAEGRHEHHRHGDDRRPRRLGPPALVLAREPGGEDDPDGVEERRRHDEDEAEERRHRRGRDPADREDAAGERDRQRDPRPPAGEAPGPPDREDRDDGRVDVDDERGEVHRHGLERPVVRPRVPHVDGRRAPG